ncbi:receptor-type tyrosine-protein phosphatase kappa-like [Carettochelys insculpta]|uniref:receptor-type tyrosine-protein phosphatase kappa-like n=1 Tax=Carettochelys insculpta TaxID=44489 RepID=UPI003EBAD757
MTLTCPEGYQPSLPEIKCVRHGNQSVWSDTPTCQGMCEAPKSWDSGLQFTPPGRFYAPGVSVTLSCPKGYRPSPPVIECVRNGSQAVWSETPACQPGVCTTTENWPLPASPATAQMEFAVGEKVWVTCPQEQHEGSSGWVYCTEAAGRLAWDASSVTCVEKCRKPTWDLDLRFQPDKSYYGPEELVALSCPVGSEPSQPVIRCTTQDSRSAWNDSVICEKQCKAPETSDTRVRFTIQQQFYSPGAVVTWSCPEGYQPSPPEIRCIGFLSRRVWSGKAACTEKCPRPQWDPSLRLVPDQPFYGLNEQLELSCPEGSWASRSVVTCRRKRQGQSYRNDWVVRDSQGGTWRPVRTNVSCVMTPQITVDLETSPTSIKLHWECRPTESCQGSWKMQAQCQLEGPQPSPCWRREQSLVQPLQGLGGTVTCSDLQPFTSYHITISGDYPATRPVHTAVPYSRRVSTTQTVPEAPVTEPFNLSTKTLRWEQLPPCRGEIVGYQLNITAWRKYNSSFLEVKELRMDPSVTEYQLHRWRNGTNYTVTIQGLTVAGLGQASRWDFETDIAEPAIPALSVRSISPSEGTAVLPLQPLPELHGPIREYQIIVSTMENASQVGTCHSPDLQPWGSGAAYLAAVLPVHDLSAPTDFVLGDGTCRSGHCNVPLRPLHNYTAIVRVVSRWRQVENSSCVRYDFSVGEARTAPLTDVVIAAAVLGLLVLLAAGALLLWLVISRKKQDGNKDCERNGAMPLKRRRGAGASRLHTQIPVAELLETLKRLRRAELAEEGAEDEANPERLPAGRDAEYQKLISGLLHPCQAGKEPYNQGKNRYKSIIPYDHCRVVLQSADPRADYINASYISGYRSPRFFIAAQGPLPGTVVDFWQMIWQEKASAIVMLTGLVEQSKPKCEQYWPEGEQTYGDFTVTLSSTWGSSGLVARTFLLQKAGAPLPRHVEQFHYLLWPDHRVPSNPARLLQLVELVNERVSEVPIGPVLVHCSAGVGRTGTFIALDILLKMARAEGSVDVFRCVQGLREQRVSMVQTKEQYAFLYEVLLEALLCGNTGVPVESIPSHISQLREPHAQTRSSGFAQEFKALQKLSELFQLSPCREAQQPGNLPKNRKPAILPADCSRPILMSSLKADGSPGYINAVFVATYKEEDGIIVTQLPLKETLVDFWALLWDYTCTSLVMLNRLEELDQTYLPFWPAQGAASYGHFHVTLISEEPGAAFTTRTLAVTNKQQPSKAALEIRCWQANDWPTQEQLPPCPATIISLLREVERWPQASQDGHVLVTCWDGASRCGLFCAAHWLCEQIRCEGQLDVSQAVRMLKRRRQQLVKDVEQYTFCYQLALSYLDSFNIYANVP